MKTLAEVWKNLQLLMKDVGQLINLFVFPIMFAAVIGSVFGGGSPTISLFVVNEDDGPYGQQVVDTLTQSDALRVELVTAGEADRRIADSEALAAVMIPAGFSDSIDAYQQTGIQIMVDPAQTSYRDLITGIMSEVLTPVVLQGEVRHGIQVIMDESGAFEQTDPSINRMVEAQTVGVIMTQAGEMMQNPQISVRGRDVEGAESSVQATGHNYSVVSYSVMFVFFILGTVAGTIMMERESGTFRRLAAAPMDRGSLIAGKMLAYVIVVFAQITVLFGVGNLIFGMPLGESLAGLFLMTLGLSLAASSLGLMVAALVKNRSQLGGAFLVVGLGMAALGGSLVAIPEGGVLAFLSKLTPHAHAIEGYVKLTSGGQGVVEVLPQAGLLAGLGVLFALIAVWRLRFE